MGNGDIESQFMTFNFEYMTTIQDSRAHTFHIPVLGLAFSIDTPIRVARYGISSVISIVDDILIEQMRKHYCSLHGEPYTPISPKDDDHRAQRITEYLNLVQRIVRIQIEKLKASAFEKGSEIVKYFEMLPDSSPLKALYHVMVQTTDRGLKATLQQELRTGIVAGAIDVNIMTKLNKSNLGRGGAELPGEYSDALAGLRGFAKSELNSSVVLSAGLNPRLYSYLGECKEFLPNKHGKLQKKVILKVSDHRSAFVQGKFLAKKGIWISEYRIESGLNCGGHAFATDGLLLGPILEEFKLKKQGLVAELHDLYCGALRERGLESPQIPFPVLLTVQGGIGTASEDRFLQEYYHVDGTGWGSPFLLVSEATNLDNDTRQRLARADQHDFYLSDASPLGIPFNNLRGSASEDLARRRAEAGKPGSPCTKKYLVTNTEFTEQPICTASRQYQSLKIKQLKSLHLLPGELKKRIESVTVKACLCEDLSAPARITCAEAMQSSLRVSQHSARFYKKDPDEITLAGHGVGHSAETPNAVAVCPGPNLAYFSKICSLEEMVGHIYGRMQLISVHNRPNMFISELRLYTDYLKKEIWKKLDSFTAKEQKYFSEFKANMLDGIAYYKLLIPKLSEEAEQYREHMSEELLRLEQELLDVMIPGARV
jgi:hypothetical protein